MKLLLDTCTFLWVASDAADLSERAREAFQDPENDVFLSAVSCWEIAVKHALGRLPLPESPESWIPRIRGELGIAPLGVDEEAALHLARLPQLHRDPFDRMLVCQAVVGGLVIVTPDQALLQYAVRALW